MFIKGVVRLRISVLFHMYHIIVIIVSSIMVSLSFDQLTV